MLLIVSSFIEDMSHLMTKPKKWHVCPAKTQISLGIRPVWSVFVVHMKKPWILSYPLSAQQTLWSDWADAQADLSLHWAHMPLCWLCHEAARMSYYVGSLLEIEWKLWNINTCTLWTQWVKVKFISFLLFSTVFQSYSTVFQSNWDNDEVIMKSFSQWSAAKVWKESSGARTWNPLIWRREPKPFVGHKTSPGCYAHNLKARDGQFWVLGEKTPKMPKGDK